MLTRIFLDVFCCASGHVHMHTVHCISDLLAILRQLKCHHNHLHISEATSTTYLEPPVGTEETTENSAGFDLHSTLQSEARGGTWIPHGQDARRSGGGEGESSIGYHWLWKRAHDYVPAKKQERVRFTHELKV